MLDSRPLRTQGLQVFVLVFLSLWSASLEAVTINAVHDTYISSANPSQSFAGAQNLGVSSKATTLLLFSLTSLPSGTIDSQIAKATLQLWVSQTTPNPFGSVAVYRATSPWHGTGVTYNTRPSFGGPGMVGSFGGLGYYIEVDVTDHVKAWIRSPSENYGVAIAPYGPGTDVLFDSKENSGTSHQPILDVTWAPKPSTTNRVPYGVCVGGSRTPVDCSCTHVLSRNTISGEGRCSVSGVSNPCSAQARPPISNSNDFYYGVCCVCD
jgi:hypothetical protein